MIRTACCIVLAFASAVAVAETRVYQWTDADGVVHFSTEPPPASVEGVEERMVADAPKPGSIAPVFTPPAPPAPAEEEVYNEEGQRMVGPEELARIRAENCRVARERVARIEPVQSMTVRRPDGTTEVLTGEALVAELANARRLVAENCQ